MDDVELNDKVTEAARAAVRALVNQSTDSNGRVKEVKSVLDEVGSFFGGLVGQKKPMTQAIINAGFPDVQEDRLAPLVGYLEFCLKQIVGNHGVVERTVLDACNE